MRYIATWAIIALLRPHHAAASPAASPVGHAISIVNQTACNGNTYTYEELAGWGLLPGDSRDKFGDTIGGIGSAIALDKTSWKRKPGNVQAYQGILYGLPDRGWNTQGTQNTQSRLHKFSVELTIVNATTRSPAAPNFKIHYLDTILLTGPDGTPCTGLDADATGHFSFGGFPNLPMATYSGDGFGGNGTGGKRIAVDSEGLVLGHDGSFWISDEYGPYMYQFDMSGKMINAIRPPDALIPLRNGSESFNAASPPIYDPDVVVTPEDPETGRANNQGLEALTASPDGRFMYALLQSATMQEGGAKSKTRRTTRLLRYRLDGKTPVYEAEFVVQLPLAPNGKVAGQSEIHFVSDTQFLVLARDSGAGRGQDDSESKYRNVDVFDISNATNIKGGEYDAFDGAVASPNGELKSSIEPAKYCPWLSYNNNDQLNRWGLLNEKWESLALVSVDEEFRTNGDGDEYYLISFSDNDFITQNGYINGGKTKYADASGFNLDTQALVFKVRLPRGSKPM
ncbi:hypothetical protein BS50DRAFT_621420 [Corynespora cassiicola Philippines]|uniref:Phytase-like domain-containing protein n=1 Tax=Corynespora cassiicola Philippines TaxID=1448308 RepID=A0A2T2NPQ4_CORCC|nr:hypothetical protein BS50DRAFT_621420 [Corynespora cassiicola Philippines]